MSGSLLGLIELLLVFAAVLGFGVWQLRSLRRDAESAAPRHPEGQEQPDPVGREAVEREALVHGRDRPPE
jgi:hypothetical protein